MLGVSQTTEVKLSMPESITGGPCRMLVFVNVTFWRIEKLIVIGRVASLIVV